MSGLLHDCRLALRTLRRSPGFSLTVVLTLAVVLAVNTTVFSLVNAFYFKPPEFPQPEQLVEISETSVTQLCAGCGVGTSYPGFRDWQDATSSFDDLSAYTEEPIVLSGPLAPEQVSGARISASLFDVLRAKPVIGRGFSASDDRLGAPPVALLGYSLWQRVFAGDHGVIGRAVRINGRTANVIGVMPRRFRFPQSSDVWLPLHFVEPSTERGERHLGVLARLRAGVSIEAARAEMAAVSAALASAHPDTQTGWTARLETLRDSRIGDEGSAFAIMLAAVGLVLAVACANLMALGLARASRRHRELALHAALGAGRGRLLRQSLLEYFMTGAAGGAIGLALSLVGVHLARAGLSQVPEVPYYLDFGIDWRVFVYCAAAAMFSGLLVGLAPALLAGRFDLAAALKQGGLSGSGGAPRHSRVRDVLIVAELALVLMLLAGAALSGKAFLRVASEPAGYPLEGLTLAGLPLIGEDFEDRKKLSAAIEALSERLQTIRGARTALSHTEFLAGFGVEPRMIRVEGRQTVASGSSPHVALAVTPGFFEAQGLGVIAGRAFAAGDRTGAVPIAVINRRMAEAIWPGQSPIGQRLQLRPDLPDEPWWTVVGVVSNVDGDPAPGRRIASHVYVPLAQRPGRPLQLLVRAQQPMATMVPALRAAIAGTTPDQPLTDVRSGAEEHARRFFFLEYFASFYAVFASFALLLAIIGVYGVVAHTVNERTREFGVRAALGADRRRLYQLVLGRVLWQSAAGVVIGLLGASLTTRLLGYLLFGISPTDPVVLSTVSVGLAAATLAAGYLPARRAAGVNPMAILRD